MFSLEEIQPSLQSPEFQEDYAWVQQSLASNRLQKEFTTPTGSLQRLNYFVEAVLASAPDWEIDASKEICTKAAEIAELLSVCNEVSEEKRRRLRLRSALLYELADLPALAAAMLKDGDVTGLLDELFNRVGVFSKLGVNGQLRELRESPSMPDATPLDRALSSDALALAEYQQGHSLLSSKLISSTLSELAKHISFGMNATEVNAFQSIILKRAKHATRSNVDDELFEVLKDIRFPTELWSVQIKALRQGLINYNYDSWGFAAPTGTGKTALAHLLIAKTLIDTPERKVLYIVPSKALVYEVASRLNSEFEPLGYQILQVSPQLIELDEEEGNRFTECSVAVLTPEKADMLLRLGASFVNDVSLIVVDEAHHIESRARGTLLELYLWRIKRIFGAHARIVFLSAVAPNILELADSMGTYPGGALVDYRSTRMRAGVYRFKKPNGKKQGWVEYSDGTSVCVVPTQVASTDQKQLIQLAEKLSVAGPVLVVARGKGTCETLAKLMKDWLETQGNIKKLSHKEKQSETIQRLDSRLEREMDRSVTMRKLLNYRIVYHHAGLPPRVRVAVEDAIRAGLADYVFATTTLAEGVNFPFSSVIVQSLALKEPFEKGKPTRYQPVTPRSFWNIAGRAGRPGCDREGQVILFEPSLGLDKVNAVLNDYLDPNLSSLRPVTSALAEGLKEIAQELEEDGIQISDLMMPALPEGLSKKAKGTINLLRVGLVHAKASNLLRTPEDILEGTFASRQLTTHQTQIANQLLRSQSLMVDNFLSSPGALPVDMIAEIGLSIQTLSELRDYVGGLGDWQLKEMSTVMRGGQVNFKEVKYIVGPVSSRMAELDGSKLGGIYTDIVVQWLSGIPLTSVKLQSKYKDSLEDLISIIYSRIQYLLPWGLYAMHRLVQDETSGRRIPYNGEILSLAYLVDAGVPNFSALRLVDLDFERVDATRLAEEYRKSKSKDTDIIGWLINEHKEILLSCLRGTDNRRLDYDLDRLIRQLPKTR